MVVEESLLVSLLRLVERMPLPPLPGGRGRPYVYGEPLIVKALLVLVLRRLPTVHSLLEVLAEPTAEMQRVRAHLTDAQGASPVGAPGSGAWHASPTGCPR